MAERGPRTDRQERTGFDNEGVRGGIHERVHAVMQPVQMTAVEPRPDTGTGVPDTP